MNNVFVYCEVEGTQVAEVSQELLTKGRKLANELGVELHAVVAGTGVKGQVEDQILPYGVDKLFVFDGEGLFPYTSAPHTDIMVNLFKEEQPQIALMGATVIGRDLGPRVNSHRVLQPTVPSSRLVTMTTRRAASTTTICCIRFVLPLVVTSWPPSSIPTTVLRWLPYALA